MSLYGFCLENCIAGVSGALVEAKRAKFELVGDVSPQMLKRLRSACTAAGGHFSKSGFDFDEINQADGFATTASRMGVVVHTLKRHVEMLSSYLQAKVESFKATLDAAENAAPEMPTMVLDPLTRRWKPSRLDEVDKAGNAVLRDDSNFYIARYGRIVKVSDEEAYLFALLYLYREKSITVIINESGSLIGVKLSDIGTLPKSVFYTLVRLQPALRKGSLIMMFYRADIDMVFRALRLAKLSPVIATEIIRLPQKLWVKEVAVISPRFASKEAGLLAEALGAIGYTVRYGERYVEVEVDGETVRIYLTSSSKYTSSHLSDGVKAILVPFYHLLTPDGALYAFKMIRTYGFSIITGKQWARILEKLCKLAEGEPAGASKLAAEALLAARSKPEIFTTLASNPTMRAAAASVIELAAQGSSSTPLDKLPSGELIALWKGLRQTHDRQP